MAVENRALRDAIKFKKFSTFNLLVKDPRVDPSAFDNAVIRSTGDHNDDHLKFLEVLLQDDRVDPRAGDSEVLRNMAKCGSSRSVSMLLQDGRVDPCALNNLALREAARYDYVDVVHVLLTDDRVDPLDGGDDCALHLAVKCLYNKTSARLIINDRRFVERRKDFGWILDAFESDESELLQLLLEMDGFVTKGKRLFGLHDWSPTFIYQNHARVLQRLHKWASGSSVPEELREY
ncbi:hypothetical protein HDU99_007540, partial [Rhizoclosmatium hyalinum]